MIKLNMTNKKYTLFQVYFLLLNLTLLYNKQSKLKRSMFYCTLGSFFIPNNNLKIPLSIFELLKTTTFINVAPLTIFA